MRNSEDSAKCRPGQILFVRLVSTPPREVARQTIPSSKAEDEISRIFAVDVQLTISVKEPLWNVSDFVPEVVQCVLSESVYG